MADQPIKGSLWVQRRSFHRENGVDLPCVYVVTSTQADYVYARPTWNTPCRPKSILFLRNASGHRKGWHDLFDQFDPDKDQMP